jgi:hypothetical protein
MRKILLDEEKANPYNLDQDTWFYACSKGTAIEIYHQTPEKRIIKIKLKMSIIDKIRKINRK